MEAVEEFASLADQYCTMLERTDTEDAWQFVQGTLALLPRLYAAAWRLPNVEPLSEEPISASASIAAEEKRIEGRIGALLGPSNLYHFVFDPFEEEAPVASLIGADLSEVYGDLRPALDVFRRGGPGDLADATWEWRFGFTTHWGRHASCALVALHNLATDRGVPGGKGLNVAL